MRNDNNIHIVKNEEEIETMEDYTNFKMESMEMINWLKEKYGEEINSHIVSVLFCQSNTDVWIKIAWKIPTALADKMVEETINLDIVMDTFIDDEGDGKEWVEQPFFLPETPIEENAKAFFEDKITLMNVTPLFDA